MVKASVLILINYFLPAKYSYQSKRDVTSFYIMPWNIDLYGHMNNADYLKYFNRARLVFLARNKILNSLIRYRVKAVVVENTVSYIKSVKVFQKVQIQTHIVEITENIVVLEHLMMNNEVLLCKCKTRAKLLTKNRKHLSQLFGEFNAK